MIEKEYIDLEEAVATLKRNSLKCFNSYYKGYVNAIEDLADIHAAKVAPVVRCKDCKYLEISGCYGECGKGYLGIVRPDCYCCYGERRIDNG